MSKIFSINQLGWNPFFQQQISLEEWDQVFPARIVGQHKSRYEIAFDHQIVDLEIRPQFPKMVVGDWILCDQNNQFVRLLERKSCFQRKAVGSMVSVQLIAANVDVALIVCSMNQDFNLNRVERYLSLVNEAGAMPIIVLSKADNCEEPEKYVDQLKTIAKDVCFESINCLSIESVQKLSTWISLGSTLAVLGSSGVGKSTLINTLCGAEQQSTGDIREDDDKGRHTTTFRTIIPIQDRAVIIDTPGMREIQLAGVESGLSETFSDISSLAKYCRFANCEHLTEPNCAVLAAIENGELAKRRLESFQKLKREDERNRSSLAERRASDKSLTRYYKKVQSEKKR